MRKRIVSILSIMIILAFTLQVSAFSSIPVKSIKLDVTKITMKINQTYKLKITISPSNTTQKQLILTTGNKKVATISQDGTITAVGKGSTVITVASAANKTKYAKCNVTVTQSTLKILTYGQPTVEYNGKTPVLAEVAKKTGINLLWETLPTGAEKDKLDLTFASGQLPDVLLWGVKDYIDNLGMKGALVPLEKLIQKAPNIKQNFTQLTSEIPNFYGKFTAADGHIYTIPAIIPKGQNTGEIFAIRKDWCDNLGLKVPTTTDELYNVLKAFKTKDPNKNGKADEIPLIERAADYYVMILANSFGTCTDVYWDDKAQKAKLGTVQPEMKEALTFIHKLYAEGLLDNEYISNTDDQWLAKMTNNTAGMMYGWGGGQIGVAHDALKKTDPKANLVGMLPVKGPHGDAFKQDGNPRVLYRGSVTKSCKDTEAAMKLFDFMYSKEGHDLQAWGIEGISYVNVGNKKQVLDYVSKNPDGIDRSTVQAEMGISGPLPWMYDADAINAFNTPFATSLNTLYASKPNIVKEYWQATLTESESKITTKYNNDLVANYINPMMSKFITGKEPLSKWDEYVAKAKELGADDYIKQYDASYRRSNNIK
jgi:ABC-type sugar transport system, periplasmic component